MSATSVEIATGPGIPPLPEWVKELRPHQIDAIEQAVDLFNDGVQVVFLNAPTGSGKTLIAEMIRRRLDNARATYICSGKSLQDQFVKDFPYANVLKGRSNYETENMPWPKVSCADCNVKPGKPDSCSWCGLKYYCPYEKAKRAALQGDLAVVNTSYFLAEANYVGNLGGRDLVIADESDMLESALMGFVEFSIGHGLLRDLNLTAPVKGAHKQTIVDWLMKELEPAIEQELERLDKVTVTADNIELGRRKISLQRMQDDVHRIAADYMNDWWVRDNDAGPLVLKPVKVDAYGQQSLWRHGARWLCMSATIISAEEQADSLGLNGRQDSEGNWIEPPIRWDEVTVPMTFPVANRPIKYVPAAKMIRRLEDNERPKLVSAIEKVLEDHNGENVLVHTHSYALTKYLSEQLAAHNPITYLEGRDRDVALAKFEKQGGVMLAPSLDRGIDLPGDLCRVQVVAKVPFPYLGDRQVSTRMYLPGGQQWYKVLTVRTLVQMTGRAVRGADDWAVTYILDKEFARFMRDAERLLPNWWKEAVTVESVRGYV